MPTIKLNRNQCVFCPIGNYIQTTFYDNDLNDAICKYCYQTKKRRKELGDV
ncbi:MAG TPA: hypothetical protein VGB37_05295 [Candidatus Lokiarchaeia archaeon]